MSLEYLLNNRKKRHIIGGVLLSASLMFAGLAITVVTLKLDKEKGENDEQLID